jgi:uncharacterized DUF497 family protein
LRNITFDPAKRALMRRHRGLDFARAVEVFGGRTATIVDGRFDYDERRFIAARELDGRLVVMVSNATWRSAPHHLDEALPCQRRGNLAPPHGLIPMTRRN